MIQLVEINVYGGIPLVWHKINTKRQNRIIIAGTIVLSILIVGIMNLIVRMS